MPSIQQAEAIKVLERAAADSKVAMDTADQSLSKREECVTGLQEEIRNLEGTEKDEVVLETPFKQSTNTPCYSDKVSTALDKFRESISALDFSYTRGSSEKNTDGKSSRKIESYHGDSSGVVADCDSEDLSDNEVFFKKTVPKTNSDINGVESESRPEKCKDSYIDHPSVEYSGSDMSDLAESPMIKKQTAKLPKSFSFKEASRVNNGNYFQFHKPLNDSRVLQVVISPLKNRTVVKHTKSSMLRLKNSPVKDPTRGRECQKAVRRSLKMDKEKHDLKRKCHGDDNFDENDDENELNTSKRRKVVNTKKQAKKTSKTKHVAVNRMGQKYNLRTRK